MAPSSTATPDNTRQTPPGGSDPVLKWFVLGSVVLALHAAAIVLAVRGFGGGAGRSSAAQAVPAGSAPGGATMGASGTTDISNMTPREAADRLYDRIARANEAGDTAQVAFFGPMALQAYANVTPLDADARLHIGLIQLAVGNAPAALAQADTISRTAGSHLFGPLLRARAAEAAGDRAAATTAFRAYQRDYDAERARSLQEYQLHDTMMSQARDDARRATGAN